MSGLSIGFGVGLKYFSPIRKGKFVPPQPDPAYPAGCIHRGKNYGRSNDDADRDIIKDLSGTGTDIQLYNFGWIEESGYNTTTYKGALVSDGVDDYGLCENFPILTKEKGYTVVAIRKWISFNGTGCLVSRRSSTNPVNGAFNVEINTGNNDNPSQGRCDNFGGSLNINLDLKTSFIFQNSKIYNGNSIGLGNFEDSNKLGIFRFPTIGSPTSCLALYALEIYDHDLTDEEIQAVKARMIREYEEGTGLPYDEVGYFKLDSGKLDIDKLK